MKGLRSAILTYLAYMLGLALVVALFWYLNSAMFPMPTLGGWRIWLAA